MRQNPLSISSTNDFTTPEMRMAHKVAVLKRYQWARLVLLSVLAMTFLALLISVLEDRPVPLPDPALPISLPASRTRDVMHLGSSIYLDYTGAGVYSDTALDLYRRDLLSHLYPRGHRVKNDEITRDELSNAVRREVLEFVGADPNVYSVVFVASATHALKLVGEHFPFTEKSRYAYTKYNHNSVLGIRKFAIRGNASFHPIKWPPDIDEVRNLPVDDQAMNLLAFPLEDNFAGTKPGHEFLTAVTRDAELRKKWAILGDAAAYLPTNRLNLTEFPLDAIVLSFYKIIGYPNTGALIIRNEFAKKLVKETYTDESCEGSNVNSNEFKLHEEMPFRYEDGAVPFQMNLAVRYGLQMLQQIGMDVVQEHVWNLTRALYLGLKEMKHSTGEPVAEIYGNHESENMDLQGGIVAFNLKRANGSYVGYSEVVREASEAMFHLRGGCHCNPGACFESMKITEDKVKAYYAKKTTCGDNNDIVDGVPLGSVRASLGWASDEGDITTFLQWIHDNYVF